MNFFYDKNIRTKTKRVVVDAGHGGDDPGANSGNILEKDLTLRAAKYMYKRLNELGIPTVIVRDEDETLSRKERIRRIMDAYGNDSDVILISNHINAGGGEGAEAVYALRNDKTLSNMILDNIEKAGQTKRKAYQKRLPEDPTKDYYFIIRDTGNIESILLEYGFIDNKNDQSKLINNIEKYVEAAVKAIADYSGVKYTPKDNYQLYIVKVNDNLYNIAKEYKVEVEEIKKINNLKSDILQIGQQLYIPINNNYKEYTVKPGDTLYSISDKNYENIEIIKKINNLTNNNLYIGQKILIPEDYEKTDKNIHIVEKGDSIWKISKIYNVDIDDLILKNNLKNNILQIGQKILIPDSKINEELYVVKAGDTLWSIAKSNNISIEELKSLNKLTTNLLEINQKLKLK